MTEILRGKYLAVIRVKINARVQLVPLPTLGISTKETVILPLEVEIHYASRG